MVVNTGVVFSASVTAQMEATTGFSFTFGRFPEATVPRNPTSGPSTVGGNVFALVSSDLTRQAPVTSRIPEFENFNVTTTPVRVNRHPAESANDLI